jgi:hypothetical protein
MSGSLYYSIFVVAWAEGNIYITCVWFICGRTGQLSQLSSRQHLIHILGPEIRKKDRKQSSTDLLANKEHDYSRTGQLSHLSNRQHLIHILGLEIRKKDRKQSRH